MSTEIKTAAEPQPLASGSPRYHFLDSLRAYAMFLGVILHASMAYVPNVPWGSHDPAAADWAGLILISIHGFRMQLFFLISGFFTMMLMQRRGVQSVLRQRFTRILIPCLLGLITVLPVQHAIEQWSISRESKATINSPAGERATAFVNAIKAKQREKATRLLESGLDPKAQDPIYGLTLLAWTAVLDDAPMADELIKRGADVNGRSRNQSTALNAAAFRGSVKVAQLLLEQNADTTLKSADGYTPLQSAFATAEASTEIAMLIGITLPPDTDLVKGRSDVARLFPGGEAAVKASPNLGFSRKPKSGLPALRSAYTGWILTGMVIGTGPNAFNLLLTNVFDHLWFLWMLWWMVVAFIGIQGWVGKLDASRLTWLSKPWRCLILAVPVGLIQSIHGLFSPTIGPDTSVGLIPQPHVFVYYAVFFVLGALVYRAGTLDLPPSKGWVAELIIANAICFPLAMVFLSARDTGGLILGGLAQGLYAWLSIFGHIGFFRSKLSQASPIGRYLSDASYFVYIFHIILVVALQHLLGNVPLPIVLKLVLVAAVASAVLLGIYQVGVRYTVIGTLLNGKKERHA